jgi:hypothetical protein
MVVVASAACNGAATGPGGRPAPGAPPGKGELDPQVDIGTFGVWQDDDFQNEEPPQAWIWRAQGYDHVEVFLFHKLDAGGFARPSNAAIGDTKRLDIAWLRNVGYGDGNPLNPAAVETFRAEIANEEGLVLADLSPCVFIRENTPGNTLPGLVRTGWYRVRQRTPDAPPTAWIHEASDTAYVESWALRTPIDGEGGWDLPGSWDDEGHPMTLYIEYRGPAGTYADFLGAIEGSAGGNPTPRKYLDRIDAGVWP